MKNKNKHSPQNQLYRLLGLHSFFKKKQNLPQISSYRFPYGLLGVSSTVSGLSCQPRTGVGLFLLRLLPGISPSTSKCSGRSNTHPSARQAYMTAAFCLSSLWSAPAYHTNWNCPLKKSWINGHHLVWFPSFQSQNPSSFCLIWGHFSVPSNSSFFSILCRVYNYSW